MYKSNEYFKVFRSVTIAKSILLLDDLHTICVSCSFAHTLIRLTSHEQFVESPTQPFVDVENEALTKALTLRSLIDAHGSEGRE